MSGSAKYKVAFDIDCDRKQMVHRYDVMIEHQRLHLVPSPENPVDLAALSDPKRPTPGQNNKE